MVSRTQWYTRVNASWPEKTPAVTAPEAIRAARKLYRFVTGNTLGNPITVTSGNRYTWMRRGVLYVNPDGGWHRLIHDLSHWLHGRVNVGNKPHDKTHARLELRMRKEALKRGWLGGALADRPPVPATAPETAQDALAIIEAPKAPPSAREHRYERTIAGIKRWQAKEKRAKTALKKLVARRRYYERTLSAP
jgi:hypothetical protein